MTVAEFDIDYVDFICDHVDDDQRKTTRSLLKMREHGACSTNDPVSMRSMGQFILGFVLQYGPQIPSN